MKIAIVWSSPNLDGLTAIVKEQIICGLHEAKADIDEIHINRLNMEHCQSCGNGWGTCGNKG